MPILFTIFRKGSDFFCSADSKEQFFVGRRVEYKTRIGLYNIFAGTKLVRLNFNSPEFSATHGFWAEFIEPTAICEGRNFLTLNTYDSAGFTFGFGQFAAHVENGDFVKYFRKLLSLPEAQNYFPHLGIVDSHIHKVDTKPSIPLETDQSTDELIKYLNPSSDEVEDSEVIAAAKLMHWTTNSVAAQKIQVDQMVSTYRGFMKDADRRIGIDGVGARECCVIADLLHHGRGGRKTTWPQIHEAMATSRPFESLIAIGAPEWDSRKAKLKKELLGRELFQKMRWSSKASDFEKSAQSLS